MSEQTLMEKINDIDADLLEEADRSVSRRRRLGWAIPVAACLALLLVFPALANSSPFTVKKLTVKGEDGYVITASLPKLPGRQLTGEIREAPAIIRQQFKTFPTWSNQSPDEYSRPCATAREAADYVGYDGLMVPYFPYGRSETTVSVRGKDDGTVTEVLIETRNLQEDVRVFVFSWLFTEACTRTEQELLQTDASGAVGLPDTDDSITYVWDTMDTACGETCQVLSSSALPSGYRMLQGYLQKDGVLYQIHLSFQEADARRAQEILRTWANSF